MGYSIKLLSSKNKRYSSVRVDGNAKITRDKDNTLIKIYRRDKGEWQYENNKGSELTFLKIDKGEWQYENNKGSKLTFLKIDKGEWQFGITYGRMAIWNNIWANGNSPRQKI